MLAFVLHRVAQSVFVMLAVALVAFALFSYVGDPINNMVGQDTSMEDREQLREDLRRYDRRLAAVAIRWRRRLARMPWLRRRS